MIELVNFTKSYNKNIAVENVSFTVEPNKITAILGANGAGKTTILKAITGIHYATSGTVKINGISVEEYPIEAKKSIGYVSEMPNFYNNFTVFEFLKFISSIHFAKLPKAKRSEKINNAITKCSLVDVQNKKIAELSKGYKQRLSFASAIMHEPSVLILDEPISGLDPVQIKEMRTLIKSLSNGRTILLSTHLMQEVTALCDELLILSKGKLVANGSLQEILNQTKCQNIEDAFLKLCKQQEAKK